MKRIAAVLLVFALPVLAQQAQHRAAAKPAAPSVESLKFPALKPIPIPKVERVTLPNGMRLYLLEDHELPLIGGTALVRTGNLFDPKDKIGLATITGMVMRTGGTARETGEQLDVRLENRAASIEVGIGESFGTARFSALKENAGEVLQALYDVVATPAFRQDRLDLAKAQMRSSIARRNDEADGIAGREFSDLVYGKLTPYGWRETYATIAAITRQDVVEFHRRYFFPANVMLGVWGDFDAAEMRARIEQTFAGWTVKQEAVPAFPKVAGDPAAGVYLGTKSDVTQTFFALGHLGGRLDDPDYAALDTLGYILGGGFQSRLVRRVRTAMGNAYDISAGWGAAYDHPGLFTIAGSTKAASTAETMQAILEEVDKLRRSEVTEAELRTAKDTVLNSLVFAFDTKTKTLGRVLTYEYFGYPADFVQRYQKALAAVTRADVLRVARTRLDPASLAIVLVGNPALFGKGLDALGRSVTAIDLKQEAPPGRGGEGNQ
jgi:zinc protease